MSWPENNRDELHWQAFRYVAGEMSDADTLAFEERMAVDQTAREALAQAVELSQAVVAATELERTVLAKSAEAAGAKSLARMAGWMALGAALCLAILLAANVWLPRASAPEVADGQDADEAALDPVARELALQWSATRTSPEFGDPSWLSDDDYLPEAATGSDDALEETTADVPAAPEWMLAAVSAQREADDMSSEMDRLQETQEQ